MSVRLLAIPTLAFVAVFSNACSNKPAVFGFLSDYSKLETVNERQMRYLSPELGDYEAFIVDPVKVLYVNENREFTNDEKNEIAEYMRNALIKVLRENNYEISTIPGKNIAVIKAALTDLRNARGLPSDASLDTKTSRAAMEVDITDSRDRTQLAAFIRTGKGNEFEIGTSDTLEGVFAAIDAWSVEAAADVRGIRSAQMPE